MEICLFSFSDVPVWLTWVSNLSWFRFAFEALAINQWENIDDIGKSMPKFSLSTQTVTIKQKDMHSENHIFSQDKFNIIFK